MLYIEQQLSRDFGGAFITYDLEHFRTQSVAACCSLLYGEQPALKDEGRVADKRTDMICRGWRFKVQSRLQKPGKEEKSERRDPGQT